MVWRQEVQTALSVMERHSQSLSRLVYTLRGRSQTCGVKTGQPNPKIVTCLS